MTGWSWDYVEETLTAPRLKALTREWQRHPPMPLLFAAWLGVTPKEQGTHDDLIARLGG